jgi:hypothetical protein
MEKFNVNIQAANWNVIIPNVGAANEDDALIKAVEIIKELSKPILYLLYISIGVLPVKL